MDTVANKLICLNLNSNWQPIGFKTVKDAIINLCGGNSDGKPNCLALNIDYSLDENGDPILSEPKDMIPVSWVEWITLPIRSWDLTINSPNVKIRVPTVIIATNFNKMPVKYFKGKPSKEGIYNRDQGICQYSGKKIEKSHATIDHIMPRSKGGQHTWTNTVLCSKEINVKKGSRLLNESGFKLLKNPTVPTPIPAYASINEAKHFDWKHFLINTK